MKYSIRRGIFETNSSSVHVIAIGKTPWKILPESLYFSLGNFGYDEGFLKSPKQRASYLYTALYEFEVDDDEYHGKVKRALKFIDETLRKNGVKAEFEDPKPRIEKDPEYDFKIADFDVDHYCGLERLFRKMMKSQQLLMQYLFSPDSVIETGNCYYSDPPPSIDNYKDDKKYRYIYLRDE